MRLVDRQLALRCLLLESLTVLFSTCVVMVIHAEGGASFLCGGFIATIGHAYFAFKLFRYGGAQATKKIVRGFYAGEAGKLAITIVLFSAAFRLWPDVKPVYLVTGFFFALAAQRLVPWVTNSSVQRN